MLALCIISLVGALVFFVWIVASECNGNHKYQSIRAYGCLILLVFSAMCYSALLEEKAHHESLKGNNPYEMVIKYELQDSVYVPTDTTFVLKSIN